MRTIKELLELMLENKDLFKSGLCMWIHTLCISNIISVSEAYLLSTFITKNRKTPILSVQDLWYRQEIKNYWGNYINFYWKECKITPRIHWIEYQIKQLNKK